MFDPQKPVDGESQYEDIVGISYVFVQGKYIAAVVMPSSDDDDDLGKVLRVFQCASTSNPADVPTDSNKGDTQRQPNSSQTSDPKHE